MQVGAVALKEFVRRYLKKNVQIAGRAAAQAGFAFTCKPDAGPILYAGRDIDRECALARNAPAAATDLARVVDHLPAAMTGRARALKRKETLGVPDLSDTSTGPARFRLGSSLRATARARFAGYRGR